MTLRLDPELKERLGKLANATHRSSSFLAGQAIHDFLELNEWQIQELQEAIKEADSDDFASNKEVEGVFDKWAGNGS
jgi:predicted transcriptional regulator